MRGPRMGPKRASRGSEKSHLLGPPHVPPLLKRDPFKDGRKGGSSQWWVRARGVCGFACTYARCSHNGPRCLSPVEAEGSLLLDDSVLQGYGGRGHSQGDRGHLAFREFPGKFPAQAPGPQVYPAHSVCGRLGVLLGSVPQRKSSGPLGGREGSCVHGQVPRDPVELL